jgi:hypothetical protein
MADDAAMRARRSRKHRGGNHTECLPARCRDAGNVTRAVTKSVASSELAANELTPVDDAPHGLQARGCRLWRDLSGGGLAAAQRVLLEEACRIADRLDRLDRYLAGDDWIGLDEEMPGSGRLIVVVDKALAESRQQATALKALLTELRQSSSAGSRRGRPPVPGKGVAGVADLSARIADRRASTPG